MKPKKNTRAQDHQDIAFEGVKIPISSRLYPWRAISSPAAISTAEILQNLTSRKAPSEDIGDRGDSDTFPHQLSRVLGKVFGVERGLFLITSARWNRS